MLLAVTIQSRWKLAPDSRLFERPGRALERIARELALTLARGLSLALRLARQALRRNLERDPKAAQEVEAECQKSSFASADHQEAVRSLLERQQPGFRER